MEGPKMKKLSVKNLIKLLRERAEILENDGDKFGYPSTKGLLIFAAMVIDDNVIGDSDGDVILPFVDISENE